MNEEAISSRVSHGLHPGAAAAADTRRMIVAQLRAWGVDDSTVEDVVMTTHELIANAHVHGDPPVDLRLVHTGSQLVVEVQDRSTDSPYRRHVEIGEEQGRGLQVVEALAAAWGARVGLGHKTVWARHTLVR